MNHYFVEQRLDLHGLEVYQAKVKVDEFINDCNSNVRQITLIHGKGTYALANYFYKEYRNKYVKKIIKAANTGETILVIDKK